MLTSCDHNNHDIARYDTRRSCEIFVTLYQVVYSSYPDDMIKVHCSVLHCGNGVPCVFSLSSEDEQDLHPQNVSFHSDFLQIQRITFGRSKKSMRISRKNHSMFSVLDVN